MTIFEGGITLTWPVITIILFVIVTQFYAWTRDKTEGAYSGISDRGTCVLLMTALDLMFVALVGGVFIW